MCFPTHKNKISKQDIFFNPLKVLVLKKMCLLVKYEYGLYQINVLFQCQFPEFDNAVVIL